ncbi:MAG: tetratricopeptide repeat protein [Paenibacillaceae bacterium]
MNWIMRISSFIIIAYIIFFAFSKHVLLGILAILILLAYLMYKKRNNLFATLANSAHLKGNNELSLQWLDKAYKVDPKHHQIAITYGYNLLKYGHVDHAEKVLEQLITPHSTVSQRSSINMNLALVRWKQIRLEEAISMLEEINERMKTSVLYGSLGYLYVEQGDLDRALAYNLEAYDYNESNTVILDNLGLTYIQLNEWNKAEEIYNKLIPLSPKFPEAYYHQGLVQFNKGEFALAYDNYVKALEQPFTYMSTEPKELIESKKDELQEKLEIIA